MRGRTAEVLWRNRDSTTVRSADGLAPGRTGRIRIYEAGAYGDKLHAIGELIDPHGEGDCWIWNGPTNHGGYGPHRTIYEVLVGVVHRGWVVHHKCGVKVCCNPDHLEAMPNDEHLALHKAMRSAK